MSSAVFNSQHFFRRIIDIVIVGIVVWLIDIVVWLIDNLVNGCRKKWSLWLEFMLCLSGKILLKVFHDVTVEVFAIHAVGKMYDYARSFSWI